MARSDYTEEELAILTPDERAALFDDSEESGENPIPSNADGDVDTDAKLDDVDLGDEGDDETDDDASAAAAAAEKVAETTDANADTGTDADAATPGSDDNKSAASIDQPAQPILQAEAPADASEKLAEIKTKKEELADQFDNGDLTGKEYQSQLDQLNRDERTIEQAIFKAQLSSEMSETQARLAWESTVDSFLGKHSEYKSSPLRHNALHITVQKIAADEESKNLTGRQILEKAHERVMKELGGVVPPKKDEVDEKGKGKETAKAKAEIPPTLGGLPAAASTDTDANRFSYLDRLADQDPQKYEKEFAKLSVTDRDAYLAQT